MKQSAATKEQSATTQELESQVPVIIFSYTCAEFDKKERASFVIPLRGKNCQELLSFNYQNKLALNRFKHMNTK